MSVAWFECCWEYREEIFMLCILKIQHTWRTFAYISSQCIFSLTMFNMVEMFFANNKKHGEEKSFRDVDIFFFFCTTKYFACIFCFREETGIYILLFFCVFSSSSSYVKLFFYIAIFFLCVLLLFLFACLLHCHREWKWMYFP